MTDARCEPPEHLRGVDGWHWLINSAGETITAWFQASRSKSFPHGTWMTAHGYTAWEPHHAAAGGWRYVAPVPSPEAVARLVEAARRMSECDLGLIPEEGCTCETCEAWHALRAALAPFKEPGA